MPGLIFKKSTIWYQVESSKKLGGGFWDLSIIDNKE
jgi:hypothetical protein